MGSIVELIRDLLVFGAVMFALLIVIVAKLPDDNRLKRILSLLSYRVGVTLGAGVVPMEPIPGLGSLYDITMPQGLA